MDLLEAKEFFAHNRADAVAMAASHYGVSESELEIREIHTSGEIFGLAGRQVFLIWRRGAGRRPATAPERERRGLRPGPGPDRGRDHAERRREREGDEEAEARHRRRRRRGGRPGQPEGVDDARLEALAREAADRVRRTGEAEILESMTAKERWVVHNYLRSEPGVVSASEGEGPTKRVKIVPA
jgi:hypothetical protein